MSPAPATIPSEQFYAELPVLEDFSAVSETANFHPLPTDWWIIVADVVNSTGAIKNGLYKEVNMVGVSVITAITNLVKPLSIPLVFGGDGASLCIPARFAKQAEESLMALSRMATEAYALNLRVGIIPVTDVIAKGYPVLVARHRVSANYIQAAFSGGGMEFAEQLIKDETQGVNYRLEGDSIVYEADLSGLECRWNNIPSRHGETISLLVKAISGSVDDQAAVYRQVIDTVQRIYGDERMSHPVSPDQLRLTLDGKKLSVETRARVYPRGWLSYLGYWVFIRAQTLLGKFFMVLGITTGDVQWGAYKETVAANTDFRKFDGTLREVLAGNAAQREELTEYLEQRYQKQELAYGIHTSTSALMTCLINDRSGDHYHFVDGSDGGYALAAVGLKQQLHRINEESL